MKRTSRLMPLVAMVMSFAHTWAQCPPPCTTFNQSPINIITSTVRPCSGHPLTISFPVAPTSFTVANDPSKHNVIITPVGKNNNTVTFNGSVYTLQQIHAHATAEHAINGARSAYELHFVFNLTSGNGTPNLVIGMWGNYMATPMPDGYKDAVTTQLINSIAIVGKTTCTGGGPINITASLNSYQTDGQLQNYYIYCGSLTAGTYAPVVTWIVCQDPVNAYVLNAVNLLISETCPGTIATARDLQALTVPVYGITK